MLLSPRLLVRLAISLILLPAVLLADPRQTLDALFKTKQFKETAVSPDGARTAWIEIQQNADRTESNNTTILVLDPGAKAPRRVTAGNADAPLCAEGSLAWSPDGAQLAFISDREASGQSQLYVVPAAGGVARKLTLLTGHLARPQWSPDGKTIALLFVANVTRALGAVEAAAKSVGEINEVIDEQRLTLVDVATGRVNPISPADTFVYEYDWSPDSREIAYSAAKGSGDNNWWIARLYAIDVASTVVRELVTPQTQIAVPRWSPDGKTIAFIQGLMSDAGSTGGDIYTVSAKGGLAQNITPGRKGSPAWLKWLPGSDRLLFTERVNGSTAIGELFLATGKTESLWQGDESFKGNDDDDLSLGASADGKITALIRHAWDRAPEVWAGPVGQWSAKTHANAAAKPLWGKSASIEWTSDGQRVQGWLLYPANYDAKQRYPMIVSIHGGPASQRSPTWPAAAFDLSAMAAEGFFVFFPNPRGSYGQGEAFTAANTRDFGHGDLRDVLAGVDEIIKRLPVDGNRLGVGGWSYGGYMTMWTVTQTNRFRAAVAGAGIANWQSYYGQNLIDQWMIPYFGASVYADPAVYEKSSPMKFINAVKTPTLIVVGDSDAECPAAQSQEFWHALKTLGVKTKLVIYENEGHHFRNPTHIEDRLARTITWFNENLR